MFCRMCGTEIGNNSFCPNCGAVNNTTPSVGYPQMQYNGPPTPLQTEKKRKRKFLIPLLIGVCGIAVVSTIAIGVIKLLDRNDVTSKKSKTEATAVDESEDPQISDQEYEVTGWEQTSDGAQDQVVPMGLHQHLKRENVERPVYDFTPWFGHYELVEVATDVSDLTPLKEFDFSRMGWSTSFDCDSEDSDKARRALGIYVNDNSYDIAIATTDDGIEYLQAAGSNHTRNFEFYQTVDGTYNLDITVNGNWVTWCVFEYTRPSDFESAVS